MKFREGWSSHLSILTRILHMTDGPVLELGMGLFSTPAMHWICNDKGRKLVSYDNEPEYYGMNKTFRSRNHEVNLLDNWDDAKIDDTFWSVAFVDHAPAGRRINEIKRLANKANFVIVHDTQPEDNKFYRYHWIWDKFKYVYHYTKASPNTSVLSNFIDLSFLK